MEQIRILHFVGKMHRGGIETLLMCIYRKLDRDKIQFDFLLTTEEPGYYDEEIKKLGGDCIIYLPDESIILNRVRNYMQFYVTIRR